MVYRREIDGLRALAVLPVIFYHAGFHMFKGGFVGVDVFFVISGYLITSLIAVERETGTFTLMGFYERRARRILPALLFVVLVSLPFAWMWMLPEELMNFSKSLISVSTFSSNILFWRQSGFFEGYFETATELKPLIHTWSLAVEEQYYLLFPFFILLIWRLGKKRIAGMVIFAACVSLAVAQWGSVHKPVANFFLLPTRGWELLIGAFSAFYLLNKKTTVINPIVSQWLSMLGLLSIGCAVFLFNKNTPFPSFYTLLPTIGTALVILYATPNTAVGKLLGNKVLVGIGLISYSIYLWHQPLLAFAKLRSIYEPSKSLLFGLLCISVLLAYVSWRFIESPFRNRSKVKRRLLVTVCIGASTFVLVLGVIGCLNKGFPDRKLNNGYLYGDLQAKVPLNRGLNRICDDKFTTVPECRTSDIPEILVWGDSFAMHLVQGILASNPHAKIVQMTKAGCGPILNLSPFWDGRDYPMSWAEGCRDFNNQVVEWIQKTPSVKFVVLSSPFGRYTSPDWTFLTDKGVEKYSLRNSINYFSKTVDKLSDIGVTPVVFSPTPENGKNIGQCLLKSIFFGEDIAACNFDLRESLEYQQKEIQLLSQIEKKHKVIWLSKLICPDGLCKPLVGSTFLYRDEGHLSPEGSAYIGKQANFYHLITNN